MPNNTRTKFLCDTCNAIFADCSYEWWTKWHKERVEGPESLSPRKYPRQHHSSYESFSSAVTQGCWLCVQLKRKFGEFEPAKVEAAGFEVLHYRLEWIQSEERFPDCWYCLSFENDPRSDHFFIERVQPWTTLHQLAETSKSQTFTGDESVAELAKGWLTHCQNQHLSCPKYVEMDWHPTRLLDVSRDPVRLRISSEGQISSPYATLSHCWGIERFWVLSKESMSQLLEGVPLTAFPNTFQQAIITVRRLGIDYLWIDCYCIIQGLDPEAQADWAYEAARMGQVYSNTVINIGAAQASSPAQGLFSTRGTENFKTINVRWRPTAIDKEATYSLRHRTFSEALDDAFYESSQSRLAERAWIVQESVLSPRMLSFNGPDVFWQCSEAAACGDFPDDEAEEVSWASHHPFWSLTDSDHLLRKNRLSDTKNRWKDRDLDGKHYNGSIHERWCTTMESYCEASLTFPDKDVFKALEGVGQRTAWLMGDVYQHGLIEETLPRALMWRAKVQWCRRSPPQRAPTWHWASYEGHLDFWNAQYLYSQARKEHWRASPVAYVFMSDDCRSFALDNATDLWPSLMCIGRPILLNVRDRGLGSLSLHSFCVRSSDIEVWPKVDYGVEADNSLDGFALLPLVSVQQAKDIHAEDSTVNQINFVSIEGLLVRGTGNGRYQRIGCFNEYGQKLLKTLQTTKPTLMILE